MPNKCDKVLPLRQYGPTCWFNSLLMAVLYSEESRKLLLVKSAKWDEKIKVLETIKFILKNKYLRSGDNNQDYPFLDKIRPETILKELYGHDPGIFKFNPDVNKGGFLPAMYIKHVYKLLGVKVLFLDKRGEKLFYSFYNTIGKYILDVNSIAFHIKHESLDTLIKDFKDPDVIIINNLDNYDLASYREHYNLNSDIFKKAFKNTYNNLDDFITQVIDLKNNIVLNTEDYVQDSVLLGNWNKEDTRIGGHSIAGITCEGDKYVYNGTVRLKLPENTTTQIEIQCELMKFDWDLNEENEFCINPKEYSLLTTDINSTSTQQCFSFNKGSRDVIYVKKNKTNTLNIKDNNCPVDSTTNPLTDKCDTLDNINKLPEHRLSYPEKIQMSGKVGYSLINTIFESVIINNMLLTITPSNIVLIKIELSLLPSICIFSG